MEFAEQGQRARAAARILATANRDTKDAALHAMADALDAARANVLSANAGDVQTAEAGGTSAALVDRLRLTEGRVDGMVSGLRQLAALPDPVGDVVRGWKNANGVEVRQVRVPFGVVAIIYEARPNVTADAGGIALKSGNAVLLRGLIVCRPVERCSGRGPAYGIGERRAARGCHPTGRRRPGGHR